MFKIVEEHPTQLEKEFKAVKEMTKENYEFNAFVFVYSFVWFLMLVLSLFDSLLFTLFVAGTVVMMGVSFFYWMLLNVFHIFPKRYRILYKKSYSSKR